MKRSHVVLIGAAGLVFLFVGATYAYQSWRAEQIRSATQNGASPLVRDYSPTSGPADAKVVLVEFFDPACEACRVFSPHVDAIVASHPGRIRLVLRYAPFHEGSDTMVKILEASRRQGRFWETLHVMYDTQSQWASHHRPQPDKIWQFLPTAGVDVEKIRRDMTDPEFLQILGQDVADATTLGVRRTPQFFVNGKPLLSFGLAQLKSLVESEIAANY